MLKASIVFLVLGLFSIILGANRYGGLSVQIGKVLLATFVIFSVIGFMNQVGRNKNQ